MAADFRTPLKIHRAAFARVAPGLDMPEAGKEAVRTAFQAADRSGEPRRMPRDVSEAIGDFAWRWPWLEDCARQLHAAGVWPHEWRREGLTFPPDWHAVPHNARVRLLVRTLYGAVMTEKALAVIEEHRRDGVFPWFLALTNGDPRCPASALMVARHAAAIRAGDHRRLPPFFPGDWCDLHASWRDRGR